MSLVIDAVDLGVTGIKFTFCFLYPVFLSCLILAGIKRSDSHSGGPQTILNKHISGLRFIVHYWVWFGILSQVERLANIAGIDTSVRYILVMNPLVTSFNMWLLYHRGCIVLDCGYLTRYLQLTFKLKRASFHDFDVAFVNPILSRVISRHNPPLVFLIDCWIVFFNQRHRTSAPNRFKKFIFKAPKNMTRVDYIVRSICYVDDSDYDMLISSRKHNAELGANTNPTESIRTPKRGPALKLNLDNLPTKPLAPTSGISPRDMTFMDFGSPESLKSVLPTREVLIDGLRADAASSEVDDKVKELTDIAINNLINGPTKEIEEPEEPTKYTTLHGSERLEFDVLPFEDDPLTNFDLDLNSDTDSEPDTTYVQAPLGLVKKLKLTNMSHSDTANTLKKKMQSRIKKLSRRGSRLVPTSLEGPFQSLPPSPVSDAYLVGRILKQLVAQIAASKSNQPSQTNLRLVALSPTLAGHFKINEDSFRRNMHLINPNKYHTSSVEKHAPTPTSTPLSAVSSGSPSSNSTPYPTEEYLF